MSIAAARRKLAVAAAHSASEAAAELLRFAREGSSLSDPTTVCGPYDPFAEPIEQLLDAAKMAIEIQFGDADLGDHGQIYGAIGKFLDGWVP